MTKKVKIAILISGRGSNMQAIIEACKNTNFPAEVGIVISNKEQAFGLEIAQKNNIPTAFINHKNFSSREDFDKKISEIVEDQNCDLICLAGFMRLVSGWFTKKWEGKLINIHPSFLPEFKGAHAVEDALKSGAKFSGCTVHFVTEEMDAGPIIRQVRVPILDGDTKEILAARILEKEHVIYPEALKKIAIQILTSNP